MEQEAQETKTVNPAADALGPWRYNHVNGSEVILSQTAASKLEERFAQRDELRALVLAALADKPLEQLRVLALGCLEGHYTCALAQLGFREVVGVDLSDAHLQRARFLSEQFYELPNCRFVKSSASDLTVLAEEGEFDVFICHGLLYHLKDPLVILDVIEKLSRPSKGSVMFLNSQFKGHFTTLVSEQPLTALQIKNLAPLKSEGDEHLVFSPADESVFERLSMRMNPASVFAALRQYGYSSILALDTPIGTQFGYSMNLICSVDAPDHTSLSERIDRDALARKNINVSDWNGRSVDGYHFDESWATRRMLSLTRRLNKYIDKVTVKRHLAARNT